MLRAQMGWNKKKPINKTSDVVLNAIKRNVLPCSNLSGSFGLFLRCGGTYLFGAEVGCELPCKSRPANCKTNKTFQRSPHICSTFDRSLAVKWQRTQKGYGTRWISRSRFIFFFLCLNLVDDGARRDTDFLTCCSRPDPFWLGTLLILFVNRRQWMRCCTCESG